MSFNKLSLASFQEALKSGKYASATAARRAVGKATTLSDGDKDKARKVIDAHFGGAPTTAAPAKKAAAKAPAKKAAAPKKAASTETKSAAPATKRAPVTRKPSVRKANAASEAPAQNVGIGNFPDLDNLSSISSQVRIAEKTIQNVGAAMNVVSSAKQQFPDADLGPVIEEMSATLSGAVGIFKSVVHSVSIQSAAAQPPSVDIDPPDPSDPIVHTPPTNNGVIPTRAESLFKESVPPASSTV